MKLHGIKEPIIEMECDVLVHIGSVCLLCPHVEESLPMPNGDFLSNILLKIRIK